MRTLLLVRHAPTSATRASAFPADEAARRARPRAGRQRSPRRCRGAREVDHEPRAALPRDGRGGRARGDGRRRDRRVRLRRLGGPLARRRQRERPGRRARLDARSRTRRRTAARASAMFCTRIARWLDAQAERDGRVVAITHGEVDQGRGRARAGRAAARVLAHRRGAARVHRAARARRALDGRAPELPAPARLRRQAAARPRHARRAASTRGERLDDARVVVAGRRRARSSASASAERARAAGTAGRR